MRQSTRKRPQILTNRSPPYNGGTRLFQVASFRPPLAVAMLALSYKASTGNVKRTTICPRFSARALALVQQSRQGRGLRTTKNHANCDPDIAGIEFICEFCSVWQRLWHAECITRLSITQASPRWLFCEPRRRPTTYPFVILSKLSPRYGDHARHGILHVSHNQGE
jgi:hypothetical protein